MSYTHATTWILVGSIVFLLARYITIRLEAQNIISPHHAIRFWILGGIIFIASLFAIWDLSMIIFEVMTGYSNTVDLIVRLVILTIVAAIIVFCVIEMKRREPLGFLSLFSLLVFIFCIISFSIDFSIVPPWKGRAAREDQKQLERLQKIYGIVEKIYHNKKNNTCKIGRYFI
jgi:hypothetical protein